MTTSEDDDGGVVANVVVRNVLEWGGPRLRGVSMCVCRDWREVSKEESGWRAEYERRWWHRVSLAPSMWRRRFVSRIVAEQRMLRLFERLELGDDKRTSGELEDLATGGRGEDLREMLASVGFLLKNESCRRQFLSYGDRLRSPPSLSSRKRFVETASPRAAASLNRLEPRVRGYYASSALAAASSQAVWWPPTLEDDDDDKSALDAGLSTISSGLRVFFDSEGVERELTRLGDLVRKNLEKKDDDSLMTSAEEIFVREGFVGNSEDYYKAENTLIDAVLDRRLGIPISLAAIFHGVAIRAGLTPGLLKPVNFPGHFFLEYENGSVHYVLDVFSRIPREPLRRCPPQLLAAIATQPIPPTRPPDVWRRALRNLFRIFESSLEQDALFKALSLHLQVDKLTQETSEFVTFNRIIVALSFRVEDTLLLPKTVREELDRISKPTLLDRRGHDITLRARHVATRALNNHYAAAASSAPRPTHRAAPEEEEEEEDDDDATVRTLL